MTPINTLAELESALDFGELEIHMISGGWWRLRRNGRTQRWKREPTRFKLPVKCGLRTCAVLTDSDLPLDQVNFVRRRQS